MLSVAVLGAGGQVGSNLLEQLSKDPRLHVWGICRNEVTAGPLRMAGQEIRVGSVTDPSQRGPLLDGCDVVVNCAAAGGLPAQARREDEAILAALCDLPPDVRLVHFSSVAVYGTCISADRNRFENPRPDWPYGRHKLRLERFLRRRAGSRYLVILRMGHVYGAGQWLSRFALQTATSGDGALPFGGEVPSNAVHVRNVVAAVRTILLERPKAGTYNLFDAPHSTWRQVFDWNTEALGVPAIGGRDDERSTRERAAYQKVASTPLTLRLLKEAFGWLRGLPGSFIAGAPTSKTFGLLALALSKSAPFERWLLRGYNRSSAKVPDLGGDGPMEPYLYADGAPGPAVEYRTEVGPADAAAVAGWYRKLARPEAIETWGEDDAVSLPSAAPARTPVEV